MNKGTLAQQIEATRRRVAGLHHQVGNAASPPRHVIENAFGELEITLDELSMAEEEVQQQNEELAAARDALETERRRYQDLFEFAPDAYLVTDTDGAIREANRAAAELLGIPQRLLLGKPLILFVAAEERSTFRSQLNRLVQAGPAGSRPAAEGTQAGRTLREEWVVPLQSQHGASFDAALTVAAVLDREDRLAALRWLLRDVTEYKRAERRLAAQHAVTQVLAKAATVAEGTPSVLEAICTSVGWEVGALWQVGVGSNRSVLVCVEVWSARGPASRTGGISGTGGTRSSVGIAEFEAVTRQSTFSPSVGLPGRVWASGEPAWIVDVTRDGNFPRAPVAAKAGLRAAFAFPIRLGGEIIGVLEFFSQKIREPDPELLQMFAAVGSQIGQFVERKRDEAALRESEVRKRAILETALDCIITIDHEGRIVEWNPAAEKTFGYSRAEVVGKQMGALIVPPAHREAHEQGLAHYLATGEGPVLNQRIEITAVRADGTEFPVELAITRIPLGGPPMFTGFVRDITPRKQMETALQERADALVKADRAKDQFLAMLAHELRNPIGAISNALQILKLRNGDDPRLQRPLEIMERQVEHQARMLEDLLNVSRIARGKITLTPRRLDLVGLVREIAEDHRNALEEAGLDLVLELPAGPLWLEGDPTRLAQSVANLLENARKFTDTGGRITVRVEAEGGQARVTIQDTGIGIEPALLPVIFESFFQGERTLDRSGSGLGLGLALVKGLVELHGGEVQAESGGIGCGTAVTLRLPMAPAALAAARVPPAAGVSAGPSRILVVEDNRDAAEALCGLLEACGCTVAVAYSGLEAIELARQFRPEMVFSDLGLPGMDGYQLAEALRGNPSLTATRLIAVSGYGQKEDQRRSQAAGFDQHLTKPVGFEELQRLMGISPAR
jgi:PAS domain S-box-containing protein